MLLRLPLQLHEQLILLRLVHLHGRRLLVVLSQLLLLPLLLVALSNFQQLALLLQQQAQLPLLLVVPLNLQQLVLYLPLLQQHLLLVAPSTSPLQSLHSIGQLLRQLAWLPKLQRPQQPSPLQQHQLLALPPLQQPLFEQHHLNMQMVRIGGGARVWRQSVSASSCSKHTDAHFFLLLKN